MQDPEKTFARIGNRFDTREVFDEFYNKAADQYKSYREDQFEKHYFNPRAFAPTMENKAAGLFTTPYPAPRVLSSDDLINAPVGTRDVELNSPVMAATGKGFFWDKSGNKHDISEKGIADLLVAKIDPLRPQDGWELYESSWKDWHETSEIMSLFGPQKIHTSKLGQAVRGVLNMPSDLVFNTVVPLQDAASDLVEGVFTKLLEGKARDVNWFLDDFANATTNLYKYTSAQGKKEMEDPWSVYNFSNGIAQVAATWGVGYLASLAAKGVATGAKYGAQRAAQVTAQALKSGMTREMAELAGKSVANASINRFAGKIGMEAALAQGAMVQAAHFRDQAKSLGISDSMSALMYFPSAMTTYLVESQLFSANVLTRWLTKPEGKKALDESLTAALGKVMKEEAVNAPSEVSKKGMMKAGLETAKGFITKFGSVNKNLTALAKSSKPGRMVSAGIEEGLEELTENPIQEFWKATHDYVQKFRAPGAEPGQGLYGTEYGDILSQNYLPDFTIAAVAGMLGGAFVPMTQDDAVVKKVIDYVAENREGELLARIPELLAQGDLSGQYVDDEGNVITQGADVQSRAENNAQRLTDLIKLVKRMYDYSGLAELKKLTELENIPGAGILKDAIEDRVKLGLALKLGSFKIGQDIAAEEQKDVPDVNKIKLLKQKQDWAEKNYKHIWDEETKKSEAYDSIFNDLNASYTKNPNFDGKKYMEFMNKRQKALMDGGFQLLKQFKSFSNQEVEFHVERNNSIAEMRGKGSQGFRDLIPEVSKFDFTSDEISGKMQEIFTQIRAGGMEEVDFEEMVKQSEAALPKFSEAIRKRLNNKVIKMDEETGEMMEIPLAENMPIGADLVNALTPEEREATKIDIAHENRKMLLEGAKEAKSNPITAEEISEEAIRGRTYTYMPFAGRWVSMNDELSRIEEDGVSTPENLTVLQAIEDGIEEMQSFADAERYVFSQYQETGKHRLGEVAPINDAEYQEATKQLKAVKDRLAKIKGALVSQSMAYNQFMTMFRSNKAKDDLHMLSTLLGVLKRGDDVARAQAEYGRLIKLESNKITEDDLLKAELLISQLRSGITLEDVKKSAGEFANRYMRPEHANYSGRDSKAAIQTRNGFTMFPAMEFFNRNIADSISHDRFTFSNKGREWLEDSMYVTMKLGLFLKSFQVTETAYREAYNTVIKSIPTTETKIGDKTAKTPLDKVDSPEQESVIRDVVAHLMTDKSDPDWHIRAIMESAINDKKKFDERMARQQWISNALWVRGLPGVGKTAVIIPTALKIHSIITGHKAKVVLVSNTADQRHQLRNTIGDNAVISTREMTFQQFIENDGVEENEIALFEESSTINMSEAREIKSVLNAHNTNAIFIGDESQTTGRNIAGHAEGFPAISAFAFRTHMIGHRFRTGWRPLWDYQELALSLISYTEGKAVNASQAPVMEYSVDGKTKSGGQYFGTMDDLITEFVNDPEEDKVFIVTGPKEYKQIISFIPDSVKDKVRPIERHDEKAVPESVQGLTVKNVYVGIPPGEGDYNYWRNQLTAVSRASNYAGIFQPALAKMSVQVSPDEIRRLWLSLDNETIADNYAQRLVWANKLANGQVVNTPFVKNKAEKQQESDEGFQVKPNEHQQKTLSKLQEHVPDTKSDDFYTKLKNNKSIRFRRSHLLRNQPKKVAPENLLFGDVMDKIVDDILNDENIDQIVAAYQRVEKVYDGNKYVLRVDKDAVEAIHKGMVEFRNTLPKGTVFLTQQTILLDRGDDQQNIGLTPDILAILPDGNIIVYDAKFKARNINPAQEAKQSYYTEQMTMYKYGLKETGFEIADTDSNGTYLLFLSGEPKRMNPDASSIAVGTTVQWTSKGIEQFAEPRKVTALSDDKQYAFVEGTNTGIPVSQLTNLNTIEFSIDLNSVFEPVETADNEQVRKKFFPTAEKPTVKKKKQQVKKKTERAEQEGEIVKEDDISGETAKANSAINWEKRNVIPVFTLSKSLNAPGDAHYGYKRLLLYNLQQHPDAFHNALTFTYYSDLSKHIVYEKKNQKDKSGVLVTVDPKILVNITKSLGPGVKLTEKEVVEKGYHIVGVLPRRVTTASGNLQKKLDGLIGKPKNGDTINIPYSFGDQHIDSGIYTIDRTKERPYGELLEDLYDNGAYVSKPIQTRDNNGKVIFLVKLNTVGDSKNVRTMQVFPRKMQDSGLSAKEVLDPMKKQLDEWATDLNGTQIAKVTERFGEMFRLQALSFIRQNMYWMTDDSGIPTDQSLAQFLRFQKQISNNGRPYMATIIGENFTEETSFDEAREAMNAMTVKQFKSTVKEVLDIMAKKDTVDRKGEKNLWKKTAPVIQTVNNAGLAEVTNEGIPMLGTYVQTFNLPHIYLSLQEQEVQHSGEQNIFGSLLPEDDDDAPFMRTYSEDGDDWARIWEDEAAVKKDLANLLGNDFVENRLWFKPNLRTADGEIYGVMTKGMVLLNTKDGKVHAWSGRHEAVHYILSRLLDPVSHDEVIDAAENAMLAEGLASDKKSISYRQVHEYLAEGFQSRYLGLAGQIRHKVDQFLEWLSQVFRRFGLFKNQIRSFYLDIESGRFRNGIPQYSRGNDFTMQTKRTPNLFDREPTVRFGESSELDAYKLAKMFGNERTRDHIAGTVANNILRRSIYNPAIFRPNGKAIPSHDLSGAIEETFRIFYSNRDFKIKRLGEERLEAIRTLVESGQQGYITDEEDLTAKEQLEEYFGILLGEPETFESIIRLLAPGYQHTRFDIRNAILDVKPEFHNDQAKEWLARARHWDEPDQINHTDTLSQKVKLILAGIPVIKANGQQTSRFINPNIVLNELARANSDSRFIDDPQLDEQGRILRQLEEIMNKTAGTTADNIRGFLHYMGNSSHTIEAPAINQRMLQTSTWLMLARNGRLIHEFTANLPQRRVIVSKMKASSSLVAAIMSHTLGVAPQEYGHVKLGGMPKLTVTKGSGIERLKNHWRGTLATSHFYHHNTHEGENLSNRAITMHEKFEFSNDGISVKNYSTDKKGKVVVDEIKLIEWTNREDPDTMDWADNNVNILRKVRMLVNLLGMDISNRTINSYLNGNRVYEDVAQARGTEYEVNSKRLAVILGTLALASRNVYVKMTSRYYEAQLQVGKLEAEKSREYKKFIEWATTAADTVSPQRRVHLYKGSAPYELLLAARGKGGVAADSLMAMHPENENVEDVQDETNSEVIIRPDSFYALLEELATVEVLSDGGDKLSFYLDAEGNRHYHNSVSSNIKDNLPTPTNRTQDNYVGQAMRIKAAREGSPFVVTANSEIIYANPLHSFGLGFDILRTVHLLDFKTDRRSVVQGKAAPDDFISSMIDGVFMQSLFRSSVENSLKERVVWLPTYQRSDATENLIAEVRLQAPGEIPPVYAYKQDGKWKLQINHSFFDNHIRERFMYWNHVRQQDAMQLAMVLADRYNANPERIAESLLADPATVESAFAELQSMLKSQGMDGDLLEREMEKSGLLRYRHWDIKDGNLVPGRLFTWETQEGDIYTYENFERIIQAESEAALRDVVHDIFFQSYMDLFHQVSRSGYRMGKETADMLTKNNKPVWYNTETDSKGNTVFEYHPALEAFMYSYHVFNNYLTQVLEGDTFNYGNFTKFTKRAKTMKGKPVDIQNEMGPGPRSTYVTVQHRLMPNRQINKIAEEGKGAAIMHPVAYHLYRNGLGGEFSEWQFDGMIKPGVSYVDENGIKRQWKLGETHITKQLMELSPEMERLFRLGMSQRLNQLFDQTLQTFVPAGLLNINTRTGYIRLSDVNETAYNEALEVVANELYGTDARQTELISHFLSKDAEKEGATSIIDIHSTKEDIITDQATGDTLINQVNEFQTFEDLQPYFNEIDNREYRVIVDYGKDPFSPDASFFAQALTSLLSDVNTMTRRQSLEQQATLVHLKLDQLSLELSRSGFPKMLKDRLRDSIHRVRADVNSVRMIGDGSVNPAAIPALLTRGVQMIINDITNEGIKMRVNGQYLTQAGWHGIKVVDVIIAPDGSFAGFSQGPMTQAQEGEGYSTVTYTLKGLYSLVKKGAISPVEYDAAIEAFSREMGEPRIENEKYVAGEAVLPYLYMKEFGLQKGQSLTDLFTITLEVPALEGEEPVNLFFDIRNMKTEQLGQLIQTFGTNRAYKQLKQNPVFAMAFEKTGGIRGLEQAVFEILETIKKTTKTMMLRTPFTTGGSGSIYNVVDIIDDHGNTVFYPPAKNAIDDSDDDIDALSVYYPNLEYRTVRQGKKKVRIATGKLADKGVDAIINNLVNSVHEFYENPANAEEAFRPIDLSPGTELAENMNTVFPTVRKQRFNDAATYLSIHDAAMMGKFMVGYDTNQAKGALNLLFALRQNPELSIGIPQHAVTETLNTELHNVGHGLAIARKPNSGVSIIGAKVTGSHFGEDIRRAAMSSKIISRGTKGTIAEAYRTAAGKRANTGSYTIQDVVAVFVDVSHENKETKHKPKEPDFEEIRRAIAGGSTITTGKQGEHQFMDRVRTLLENSDYHEIVPGVWNPKVALYRNTSRSDNESVTALMEKMNDEEVLQRGVYHLMQMITYATDNTKTFFHGAIGHNQQTAPIFGSLLLFGQEEEVDNTLPDNYRFLAQVVQYVSKPHIAKILRGMRSAGSLTQRTKNPLFMIEDDIVMYKDKLAKVDNMSAFTDIRSADMVKRHKERLKREIDEEMAGPEESRNYVLIENNQQILESLKRKDNPAFFEQYVQKMTVKYEQAIMDLEDLKEHYIHGQAINRFIAFMGLNQGLPVKEYDIYQRITNYEFYLNESLDEFVSDKPSGYDWKSQIQYRFKPYRDMKTTEIQLRNDQAISRELMEEELIRGALDVGSVLKVLPNYMSYLRALNWVNKTMATEEIRSSDIIMGPEGLLGRIMEMQKITKDRLSAEQFHEFRNLFNKLMVSMHLQDRYHNFVQTRNALEWMSEKLLDLGQGTFDGERFELGTLEGNTSFAMLFPELVRHLKGDVTSENIETDRRIASNQFIRAIQVNTSWHVPEVILPDVNRFDDTDLSILQNSFSALETISDDLGNIGAHIQELFRLYQMIRWGFENTSTNFMMVLDNINAIQFSNWYNTFTGQYSEANGKWEGDGAVETVSGVIKSGFTENQTGLLDWAVEQMPGLLPSFHANMSGNKNAPEELRALWDRGFVNGISRTNKYLRPVAMIGRNNALPIAAGQNLYTTYDNIYKETPGTINNITPAEYAELKKGRVTLQMQNSSGYTDKTYYLVAGGRFMTKVESKTPSSITLKVIQRYHYQDRGILQQAMRLPTVLTNGKASTVIGMLENLGIDALPVKINGRQVALINLNGELFLFDQADYKDGFYHPELIPFIELESYYGISPMDVDYSVPAITDVSSKVYDPQKYLVNDILNNLIGDATNLQELLKSVNGSVSNTQLASLIRALGKQGIDLSTIGLSVNHSTEMDLSMAAYFSPRENEVMINVPSVVYRSANMGGVPQALAKVLTHETWHALTSPLISTYEYNPDALEKKHRDIIDRLNTLYNFAKAKSSRPNLRGFSSLHEFTAEAMSNDEFKSVLDEIDEVPEGGFLQNLWSNIVDVFSELLSTILGKSPSRLRKEVTALTLEIMRTYDHQMMRDYGIRLPNEIVPFAQEKMNDIHDITNILPPKMRSVRSKESIISLWTTKVRNSKDKVLKFHDKELDFTGLTSEQIQQKIVDDIYNETVKWEGEIRQQFVDWLQQGANDETFSEYMKRSHIPEEFNDLVMEELKYYHLDHIEADEFFLLNSPRSAELGIQVEGIEGFNPVVAYYGEHDGVKDFSIFDITSMPIHNTRKGNLLNVLGANSALAGSFYEDERGLRRLVLSLQALSIANQIPNSRLRRIGILRPLQSTIQHSYINMREEIEYLQQLKDIEGFVALLPDRLKEALTNEELFKPDRHKQAYLWYLRRFYEENEVDRSDRDYNSYKGMARLLADNMLTKDNILEAMKFRMSVLSQRFKKKEDLYKDQEFKLLSDAVREIDDRQRKGTNVMKDMGWINARWLKSGQTVNNDIVQWAVGKVQTALYKVKDDIWAFKEWHKPWLQKVNDFHYARNPKDRLGEFAYDTSAKKFDFMWKKVKLGDTTVRNGEIHWDINNAETKRALSEGVLTKEMVQYGKELMDRIESLMERYLAHRMEEYSFGHNAAERKKDAMAKAKAELARVWKKGNMPIIPLSVAQTLFKGDVKKGWDRIIQNMTEKENLFDDLGKSVADDMKVGEFLVNQFDGTSYEYGSNKRLERLGLSYDGADVHVEDPKRNHDVNTDLEFLGNLMMLSLTRKMELESRAMHAVNAANAILYNYNNSEGEDMKWNLQWLNMFTERVVHGRTGKVGEDVPLPWQKPGEDRTMNMDAAFNALMTATIFNNMAFNVPSSITQFIVSFIGLQNFALSNTVGNTQWFGMPELVKAFSAMFTDSNKFYAVIAKYHFADHDERMMTDSRRHQVTQKNIWSSYYFQYLNWAPDFMARSVGAVAQMMKDGSWDAHTVSDTGILSYNEDNDQRWKGQYGKILRDTIYKENVAAGLQDPDNKRLERAYEPEEVRSIMDSIAQNIVGGYNAEERTNASYHLFGKLFSTYHTFIYRKWENLTTQPMFKDATGKWDVELVKDDKGNEVAVPTWKKEYFEGKIQSLAAAVREIKKAHEQDIDTLQALRSMPARSKQNLARLTADLVIFGTLYLAFGFKWDDDDEDKNRTVRGVLYNYRLGRSIKYAIQDLINEWHPVYLIDMVKEPAASVTYAYKLAVLLTSAIRMDLQETKNAAAAVAPLGSTAKMIKELYNSVSE